MWKHVFLHDLISFQIIYIKMWNSPWNSPSIVFQQKHAEVSTGDNTSSFYSFGVLFQKFSLTTGGLQSDSRSISTFDTFYQQHRVSRFSFRSWMLVCKTEYWISKNRLGRKTSSRWFGYNLQTVGATPRLYKTFRSILSKLQFKPTLWN